MYKKLLKNMYLIVISLIICLSLFLSSEGFAAEIRLVSLKPNITEILVALGMGSHLVGVTRFCKLPPGAKPIPVVADYVSVDTEKILGVSPTWVIGSQENSLKKEVDFLSSHGIRVMLHRFTTLADTYKSIQAIADGLGLSESGGNLVAEMKRQLDAFPAIGLRGHPLRVLLVVGRNPLVVVGGDNLLDDILFKWGISNPARASRLRYPVYGVEQLLSSQPDVIIDLTMGTETNQDSQGLGWYGTFRSLPAVQNNRVYFLDVGDFHASPQLLVGVKKFHEVLAQ